jgi:hypothetical protein
MKCTGIHRPDYVRGSVVVIPWTRGYRADFHVGHLVSRLLGRVPVECGTIRRRRAVFASYRAAFDKATAIEEVFPYMSKDVRAEIEATPVDQRAEMLELLKEMQKLSNVKVVKETTPPTASHSQRTPSRTRRKGQGRSRSSRRMAGGRSGNKGGRPDPRHD